MSLLDLPDELFTEIIIPNLNDLQSYMDLSITSKRLRKLCKKCEIKKDVDYDLACYYYRKQKINYINKIDITLYFNHRMLNKILNLIKNTELPELP